jgi:hypothetical protein
VERPAVVPKTLSLLASIVAEPEQQLVAAVVPKTLSPRASTSVVLPKVEAEVAVEAEVRRPAVVPTLFFLRVSISVELQEQLAAVVPTLPFALESIFEVLPMIIQLFPAAVAPMLFFLLESIVAVLQGQQLVAVVPTLPFAFFTIFEVLQGQELAGQHPDTFHKTSLVLLPLHFASLHTSQPHQVRLLMLAAALLIAAVTAVPAVPAQSHHRKEVYLGVAIIDRMD